LNTYIEIGKSIINKYANYAKKKIIDDEEEYFPTLRIIILGIVETSNQKKIQKSSMFELGLNMQNKKKKIRILKKKQMMR
jgi:hypothetical protein